MSNPFVDPSTLQGGSYFKTKDNLTALAVLFEPKSINFDVPGKFGVSNEVVADVAIFKTQADLDSGVPSEIHTGMTVSTGTLVKALSKIIGGATVTRLSQEPMKNGNGTYYALNPVGGDVAGKAAAWLESRDQEREAKRSAAPSFS